MVQRSETSRQAILDATLELLDAKGAGGTTVQKLTIESIAKRAGVSKATIYRWWPNKAAVVLDAFVHDHVDRTPIPTNASVRESLRLHIASVLRQYASPEGQLVAQIIAEGQYDETALQAFRERFWYDRYRSVNELVQRGIDDGEIRRDIDPSMAATIMYAPIYQRLLLGSGPLDDAFADAIIEATFQGLAPRD